MTDCGPLNPSVPNSAATIPAVAAQPAWNRFVQLPSSKNASNPPDALPATPSALVRCAESVGSRAPTHPAAAAKAGFDRPILHGLCTYGVVGYLLTRTVCDYDPARLLSIGARFSSPVFPGETIRLEAARRSDEVFFRATVPERDEVVLSQGFALVR